jgi:type IV secretory pathway VirB2 component (pilin)
MSNKIIFVAIIVIAHTIPDTAHASTLVTGLPWEPVLTLILESITGPVARVVSACAVVITGLTWMLGEHGRGGRQLFGVAFGVSLALGALNFLEALGFDTATF